MGIEILVYWDLYTEISMVMGGTTTGGTILYNTELYTSAGTWTAGPDLPKPLVGHCALVMNDNEVLITGGITGVEVHWHFSNKRWTK